MIVVWNRATQETFLKARFVIFRCQKYVKKGYIEMTKKITLSPLKGVLGCYISHYCDGGVIIRGNSNLKRISLTTIGAYINMNVYYLISSKFIG